LLTSTYAGATLWRRDPHLNPFRALVGARASSGKFAACHRPLHEPKYATPFRGEGKLPLLREASMLLDGVFTCSFPVWTLPPDFCRFVSGTPLGLGHSASSHYHLSTIIVHWSHYNSPERGRGYLLLESKVHFPARRPVRIPFPLKLGWAADPRRCAKIFGCI